MEAFESKTKESYLLSNLVIIRWFALWGILDALVMALTSGNKLHTILVYTFVFLSVTFLGLLIPEIMDIL
jgi:succinate-acetate transporter protein